MTAKNLYNAMLIELNKVNAPSLLLEDYNYFINKAVNQYINKKYNIYDINQQSTDDLRVLKATATLPANKIVKDYGSLPNDTNGNPTFFQPGDMLGATYEIELPKDYLHMLNCTCVYKIEQPYDCYPVGKYWTRPATRLTADAWSVIQDNAYMCPSYRRPYYYIHNVNQQKDLPTNIYSDNKLGSTDQYVAMGLDSNNKIKDESDSTTTRSEYPRKISLKNDDIPIGYNNSIDKSTFSRSANPTSVRCEIRYGKDDTVFKLEYVLVDYIKAPQHIKLTQEQIDLTIDRSQVLEFSDNVCQEIINELVLLVMENSSDGRMQTHLAVTRSIADPAQQQQQPTKAS